VCDIFQRKGFLRSAVVFCFALHGLTFRGVWKVICLGTWKRSQSFLAGLWTRLDRTVNRGVYDHPMAQAFSGLPTVTKAKIVAILSSQSHQLRLQWRPFSLRAGETRAQCRQSCILFPKSTSHIIHEHQQEAQIVNACPRHTSYLLDE
jgi:hypothetical protein